MIQSPQTAKLNAYMSSSRSKISGTWVTFHGDTAPTFVPADNWVGFDLDGTLTRTDNPGHFEPPYPIGEPIADTVDWAKKLLAMGIHVKIFTARACEPENIQIVKAWAERHGLGRLEVTNAKDYNLIRYYDDRAIQVVPPCQNSSPSGYRKAPAINASFNGQVQVV